MFIIYYNYLNYENKQIDSIYRNELLDDILKLLKTVRAAKTLLEEKIK